MLLWRRLLPSAAGTAEPRPGGRGGGGGGGERGSRCGRAYARRPGRLPPARSSAGPGPPRHLASPRLARAWADVPGVPGSGSCPALHRARPGPPGRPGRRPRRCGRAGAVSPGGGAGWRALRPGPGLPAAPRSRAVSRRWLSASPGGLWVFAPERSAPPSQVPSRGQTGLGHYLLMPVCKRLLFTSWLRIFEASKLRGCLFFFFLKEPTRLPVQNTKNVSFVFSFCLIWLN